MNLLQVHKALISGRFTLIISVLAFLLLRLFSAPDWNSLSFWGATGLQLVIALFMLQINHTYTIIRNRTLLPTFFYLLFTGTNPTLYNDFSGTIAAFCILLSFVFLFHSYQDPKAQNSALNISLILTLGSLLWSPLLLFFPLFWYGFYRFRCLNFRTFFATLIGVLTIYLFILVWSMYTDNRDSFLSKLPQMKNLFTWQPPSFDLREWITFGVLITLYGLSGFNLFVSGVSEKIRTSAFLNYLYVFSFFILVMLLIQSGGKREWLLIIHVPAALVMAHFFTLSNKKITTYLLLISILFFLGMYGWQLFLPGS